MSRSTNSDFRGPAKANYAVRAKPAVVQSSRAADAAARRMREVRDNLGVQARERQLERERLESMVACNADAFCVLCDGHVGRCDQPFGVSEELAQMELF